MQTLNHKKKIGNTSYNDNRGKNLNSHKHILKFTKEDCKLVCEHIDRFPRQESHYGKSKSTKQCLSTDLNYYRMYCAFKDQHAFKKRYCKLSFGISKTDACSR